MEFHFLVRFEPRPGKAAEFREALLTVIQDTRREEGCIAVRVFESVREPAEFGIHSEWTDEASFERHVELPHTRRFLEAADRLLTHPIEGLRSRCIAGGAGPGAT